MSFQHIYLDMDGVIVDWDAGIRRLYEVDWYPTEWAIDYQKVFGRSKEMFWWDLDNRHFWSGLPWTKDGKRIVSILEPFKPVILSACCVPAAFLGKHEWLLEHYNDAVDEGRFLFTTTDGKINVVHDGAIIIDDREATCELWEHHGGKAILYPRPWNSMRDVKYPLEYLMSELMRKLGGS
jgi:hypothetical protein